MSFLHRGAISAGVIERDPMQIGRKIIFLSSPVSVQTCHPELLFIPQREAENFRHILCGFILGVSFEMKSLST